MQKTVTRLVALALCVVMFAGLFGVQAFAAEEEESTTGYLDWYNEARDNYYDDLLRKNYAQETYEEAYKKMVEKYIAINLAYEIAKLAKYIEANLIYEAAKQRAREVEIAYDIALLERYLEVQAIYEAAKEDAMQMQIAYNQMDMEALTAAQEDLAEDIEDLETLKKKKMKMFVDGQWIDIN